MAPTDATLVLRRPSARPPVAGETVTPKTVTVKTETRTAVMRALLQTGRGGPAQLTLVEDRPRPTAGPGEYLIRVTAAGLNFADVMQTHGSYHGGPHAPYVAGFEVAGEIIAVGPGIDAPLPVGTSVLGSAPGAFAEFATVSAAEALVIPDGWSSAESLGMVLNWATALAAVWPLGQVGAGDVVLVHAAAGGVGQAAVRLARHYGATVIAAASPIKHDVLRDLGAHAVLDSRGPDLERRIREIAGDGVDVVLESVGRATLDVSLRVAKPIVGRVVVFGAASGMASVTTDDLVFHHPVQLKGLHIGRLAVSVPQLYAELIDELQVLRKAGVYPPGRPQVHALADGPEVLCRLGDGMTHGKHALDPRL